MKEKDKELLIKDLSARVLYGVKVNIEKDYPNNPQIVERVAKDGEIIVDGIRAYDIHYYKPYLRPLSSMTEEEFTKLKVYSGLEYNQLEMPEWYTGHKTLEFYLNEVPSYVVIKVFDWLNAHHFDYRGLIEKSLAIVAPDNMYK